MGKAAAAALLVVIAACAGGDGALTAPGPGPASTTTSTGPSATPGSTSTTPPSTSSPPATAVSTTGTATTASTEMRPAVPIESPLLMGMSIHVEGWAQEAANEDMYRIHVGHLDRLADIATAHGAVLTFELSAVFVEAHRNWEDDFIDRAISRGHEVAVHADVGGRDPRFPDFVSALVDQRRALESQGVVTEHVTGICSASPWVEAALEAGFSTTGGTVEYCLKSLDPANLPASKADVASCTTPAQCHGPPVDSQERRMYPWRTDDSSNWLDPAEDGLLMMLGESGSTLPCLAEERTTGGVCETGGDDIAVLEATIDDYLSGRSQPRQGIFVITWSWGNPGDDDFVEAAFTAIGEYVSRGDLLWAGMTEIAAATG